MSSIADTLNKAADLIEERGWWDGTGDFPKLRVGPTCAGLAIREAQNYEPLLAPVISEAGEFLTDYLGSRIPRWNDAQPDGETVVSTLRAAALTASITDLEAVGDSSHHPEQAVAVPA